LKSTKTKQARIVPIPTKAQRWLSRLTTDRQAGFVFSTNDGASPTYYKTITNEFYSALSHIRISNDERRFRNISFHSWRNFYNSLLRGRIPDAKLRRLTGHRTAEMTERYTHYHRGDFADVLAIQEQLSI